MLAPWVSGSYQRGGLNSSGLRGKQLHLGRSLSSSESGGTGCKCLQLYMEPNYKGYVTSDYRRVLEQISSGEEGVEGELQVLQN